MMKWGLPENVAFGMYAGRIGEGAATELVSFLRLFKDLPTAKEIANSPKRAPVPKEPSALYGSGQAFIKWASENAYVILN